MSHDNGKTIKIIEQHLINAGYFVEYKVLNTIDYADIPQNRERIYIVGFKNKNALNRFEFPQKKPLSKTLLDVLEKHKVDDKYYYNDKPLFAKIAPFIDKTNTAYQWRRKYVLENKSGGHNVPIIKDNFGIRKLTPRECARLQGFNDTYIFPQISDSHLYKQIGNSVSIPVIEQIVNGIKMAV